MLRPASKWMVISAAAGVTTYYCEWLELVRPGTCNQGMAFTVARMYVVPLLLVAVVGYRCPGKPLVCWLFLMLPSFIIRFVQLASSAMSGSNLAMPMIGIDTLHFLFTGVIAWGAARFGRL